MNRNPAQSAQATQPESPTKLYIPIAGTWSRKKDGFRKNAWYRTDSPFDKQMMKMEYTRVDQNRDRQTPDRGFWSGDVGGLLIQGGSTKIWRKGARNLAKFMIKRRTELEAADEVALIAHSHGGQVVAFALQRLEKSDRIDLRNIRVVTVDMPVRSGRLLGIIPRGMGSVYAHALYAVGSRWTHLYSKRTLKIWKTWPRFLGSRFGPRKLKGANNIEVPGGHSGVLKDPDLLLRWTEWLPPR